MSWRQRNRSTGPLLRWRAYGRMRNVEIFSRSLAGPELRLFRRAHHGCRRVCFWLITQPHLNHRAPNGRSKKEDFAIAAQYAPVAPCAEAGRLRRMPELRRAEAAASPMRILRIL